MPLIKRFKQALQAFSKPPKAFELGARLTLKGKAKVVQELKVALFGALLRQDLDYLEQCRAALKLSRAWENSAREGPKHGKIGEHMAKHGKIHEKYGKVMENRVSFFLKKKQMNKMVEFQSRLLGDLWQLRSLIGSCGTTMSQARSLSKSLEMNLFKPFEWHVMYTWKCVRPFFFGHYGVKWSLMAFFGRLAVSGRNMP